MSERKLSKVLSKIKPKFSSFGKDTIADDPGFLFDIIYSSPVGLLATDKKGIIVMFNNRARLNLELPTDTDDWIGKPIFGLVAFSSPFLAYIKAFLAGKMQPYDLLELEVNGKHLTVRGWFAKGGMVLALNDVTRLKNMEAASLGATIQGQENERSRLAKEIHDGIGPLLSTLKLYLESLGPDVAQCSEEARKKYRSMKKLVTMLTLETRNISRALMPIAVEDFGLVAALEDMVEKVGEGAKLSIHFYASDIKVRLEHQLELGLYRIVQELLNNTMKYAKAHTVNVQLIRHKDSIVLTYEDDGVGFEADGPKLSKGYGLRDIQARVKSLGGSFSLDTMVGRGVVVTVELPVL